MMKIAAYLRFSALDALFTKESRVSQSQKLSITPSATSSKSARVAV
jgi:hypothetical protein